MSQRSRHAPWWGVRKGQEAVEGRRERRPGWLLCEIGESFSAAFKRAESALYSSVFGVGPPLTEQIALMAWAPDPVPYEARWGWKMAMKEGDVGLTNCSAHGGPAFTWVEPHPGCLGCAKEGAVVKVPSGVTREMVEHRMWEELQARLPACRLGVVVGERYSLLVYDVSVRARKRRGEVLLRSSATWELRLDDASWQRDIAAAAREMAGQITRWLEQQESGEWAGGVHGVQRTTYPQLKAPSVTGSTWSSGSTGADLEKAVAVAKMAEKRAPVSNYRQQAAAAQTALDELKKSLGMSGGWAPAGGLVDGTITEVAVDEVWEGHGLVPHVGDINKMVPKGSCAGLQRNCARHPEVKDLQQDEECWKCVAWGIPRLAAPKR